MLNKTTNLCARARFSAVLTVLLLSNWPGPCSEQIATVKAWIDQGAEWPDELANEADLPPFDPKAIAMVDSLRAADLSSFLKAATTNPALLNARGPEGSTPFMYAVLYTSVPTLTRLLKMGADPNKHNDLVRADPSSRIPAMV